jgi:hypothetical protein
MSEDAIKVLVDYVSMVDHLHREGAVSLPAPGTNWADWLNALGREMYLQQALDRLNLEYPSDTVS